MGRRSLFFRNALLQFSFFISFCVLTVFTVLYLQSVGFSTLDTGIIFGLGNLCGALLQLVTGQLADASKVISLRMVIFGHALLALVFMIPVVFFQATGFIIPVAFFVFVLISQAIQGPINAVSVAFEQAGYPISFSVIRGIGSASYGLTSLAAGFYFESRPITDVPLVLFCGMLLFMLCIFLVPPVPAGVNTLRDARVEPDSQPTKHFYRKYPFFVPLLIGFTLLFAGHMIINNFLALLVENVGGSSGQVGVAVSCAIVMETTSLMLYGRFRRMLSDRALMAIAACFFTVKAFILSQAADVGLVYVSQFFQFATFPFLTGGISYFSADVVEVQDLVKGQNVVTIIMALGGAIGSTSGGFLLNYTNAATALMVTVAISLVGTLIALYGIWSAGKAVTKKDTAEKAL